MNRFALWLVERVTPREPLVGGRDVQARITYYRSRDERRARATLYPKSGNVQVQPRTKR